MKVIFKITRFDSDTNSISVKFSYEKSSSAFKVRFESPRVNISKIVLSKKTIQNQINRIELAKAMINYVLNFNTCRNQFMLSYFDENKTSPCHNCDNCEIVTQKKLNPNKIIERAVIMTLTYEHKDAKTIHDEFENIINKKELTKVFGITPPSPLANYLPDRNEEHQFVISSVLIEFAK